MCPVVRGLALVTLVASLLGLGACASTPARSATLDYQVTVVMISRAVVQPALQGPWVHGIPRAEYTIGVTGCGRRETFVVMCPQYGDGCFAAGPGRFHDWPEVLSLHKAEKGAAASAAHGSSAPRQEERRGA